ILPQREIAPAIAARCPECAGSELVALPFDFGMDPESGYHDAGERFLCRACGATGEAAEVAFEPANVRKQRRAVGVNIVEIPKEVAYWQHRLNRTGGKKFSSRTTSP